MSGYRCDRWYQLSHLNLGKKKSIFPRIWCFKYESKGIFETCSSHYISPLLYKACSHHNSQRPPPSPPHSSPLPLHQFDLVGSNCVCSHTCTPFYPHSSHSGNMLTDSCTSKICSLSRFHGYHLLWELYGVERGRERERESQAAGCVVGPIWMIGPEMQAETGFPVFL